MKTIVLSLPTFFTRVPDQSIVASPTFESTSEAARGDTMISGMRGSGWCAVHLPQGGTVSVNVYKAVELGEGFRPWWIDPSTGGRVLVRTSERVSQVPVEFKAPDPAMRDWILMIERA